MIPTDLTRGAKAILAPIAYDTQSYLGQYWTAYSLITSVRLRKSFHAARNRNLVTRDTGLCVEGPTGSGNSFFVNGFAVVNPQVRLAHHHHVAAQVKRAVELRVPTVVLLRHPVDSIASRAWRSPQMIGPLFRQWIRFFRTVERLLDSVLIAAFESATGRPSGLVQDINKRFDASFCEQFPDPETVYAAMDRSYSAAVGAACRNPNRPDVEKRPLKQKIRPLVARHHLASVAGQLYDQLRPEAR